MPEAATTTMLPPAPPPPPPSWPELGALRPAR